MYEKFGPNRHLAQTWTPHWLAQRLWDVLTEHSIDDDVADLCAGAGRLVDHCPYNAKWTLNEKDSELAEYLRTRYSQATVLNQDFMSLNNQVNIGKFGVIVGSPPWMETALNGDLIDRYVEACERCLLPGGFVALCVPVNWRPTTIMKRKAIDIPTLEELNRFRFWKKVSRPSIQLFEL